MTLTRIIAANTLAQYLGKGISLIASIVVTSILTRRLGTDGYGQYVYVFTLVLFLSSLSDWGSTFIATREASRSSRPSTIFSTALTLRLLISLAASLIIILAALIYPPLHSLQPPIIAASFLLPLVSLKTSFQIIFQTRLQLWRLSFIDTLSSLVFMAVLLFLPPSFFSLTPLFISLVGSTLVGVLAGTLQARRLTPLRLAISSPVAKLLITQSLSMGALLTLFSFYNRLDTLILKSLQGNQAVGLYGLAYKIYEHVTILAAMFANAAFPILSSRSASPSRFRLVFQKYLSSLFLFGLLASFATFLLAPLAINLVAGPEFVPSIVPLRILAFALVVSFLNHATGYSLVALNRQHLSVLIAAAALGLNLTLNLIFIPRFSFLAASFITIITELAVFVPSIIIITRFTGPLQTKQIFANLDPSTLIKKFSQ